MPVVSEFALKPIFDQDPIQRLFDEEHAGTWSEFALKPIFDQDPIQLFPDTHPYYKGRSLLSSRSLTRTRSN